MNNSVKIAHFEPKQSSFLQKLATTARFARLRGLLRLHASITLFKIRFLLSENFLTKFKVNQMWRKVNSKKIKANPMCFSQCTPYMVKLTQRGAFDKIQSYPNVLPSAKRNDSVRLASIPLSNQREGLLTYMTQRPSSGCSTAMRPSFRTAKLFLS